MTIKGRRTFIPPSTREAEILDRLGSAEDMLRYATDVDHYCEDKNCTLQTPQCRDRHAEAALDEIRRLLEPPHVSLQPKRRTNDAERIYADRWVRENERRPAINSGFTMVEHILLPDGQRIPERVSQRDAAVAASVIQWLGTNCGHAFVLQCEKEIEVARSRYSRWKGIEHRREYPETKDRHTDEAEQLTGRLFSVLPESPKLREAMAKLLAAALQAAEERGAAEARDRMAAALGPVLKPVEAR